MLYYPSWLRKVFPGAAGHRKPMARNPRSLLLERLEERITPTITIATSYAGLNVGNSGGYVSPDDQGAAGTTSYIQTANQEIELFPNKNSGSGAIRDSFPDFWYNQGGLPQTDATSFLSDPIVVWDEQIGRFIVGDQDTDSSTDNSNFDLAISNNASPATLTKSDWTFVQVKTTEANYFADYPGNFGWNHDVFVFTLNMFGTNSHVQVDALDINKLLAGTSSNNQQDLTDFSVRPTVMHDSVAGDPMWLLSEGGNGQSINVYRMNNPDNPASSSFTKFSVAVLPYTQAVVPLQKNGSQITFNEDSRILKAAEYGGMLVASHEVSNGAGDRDYARWYEFNVSGGSPTLFQQGNVTDPTSGAGQVNVYDTYAGIDINSAGDIGMTYMQSGDNSSYSATGWISAFDTVWTPSDPAGVMEPPVLVLAGSGANNDGREGNMTGINTDSDGTFWATTQVTNSATQWVEETSHFVIGTISVNTVNLTNGGNLIVSESAPAGQSDTLTVNLVTRSGVAYVEVHDPSVTLQASGNAVQVDNNTVDAQLSRITGNIQVSTQGGNVTLAISFSGGDPVPSGGISYVGGGGSDTLTLAGGAFTNASYTYPNGSSANLALGSNIITVAGLTSITDSDTYTNETFNLPAAVNAVLKDDGTSGNGVSQIASPNSTLVTTSFSDPTGMLSAITNGSGSLVQLAAMDGGFAPILENFTGKSGDVFQFVAAGAVPSSTNVTLTTATLDLSGLSPTINALNGNGTIISSAPAGTLTVGASNGTGTFSGIIQDGGGTAGLGKTGTGTETLTGANTYSGPTTITGGTLVVGSASALSSNSDVTDNATLDLGGFSDAIGALAGSGIVTSSAAAAVTLTVGFTGDSGTFSGVIQDGSGTMTLAKTGSGTETLSGANTYSGTTTISAGTLQLGAANAIPATSDVTDNATLDLAGLSPTIGALAGSGSGIVTNSAASTNSTLNVGATNNGGTFSGILQNGNGTVALSKTGSGTEIIAGTRNTYTGPTLVSAGTLEVDGTIVSPVTVSGTGVLTGSGTVKSVTTTGGALEPGSLTSAGLILNAGSAFDAVIGGSTPGAGSGKYSRDTVASGTVTIDTTGVGVALNVSAFNYVPTPTDVYILVANNVGSAINGTFVAGVGIDGVAPGTPLTEGMVISHNFLGSGISAKITYTYQSGPHQNSVAIILNNDVTISVGAPSKTITNTAGGPVTYKITYNDLDNDGLTTNLSSANVTLIATGTATGTLSFANNTAPDTGTVTVTPTGGNGTLAIAVGIESAVDQAGNTAPGAGTSTAFILYNNPVGISITGPSKSVTSPVIGPVTYTVTYSDPYFVGSSLTASDITLNNAGGNASASVAVSGSGTTYTVTLGGTGLFGNGPLGITVDAGTATDQAGNTAPSATSQTFLVDATPVGISISSPSRAFASTASGAVTYTVTYTDSDFLYSALTLNNVHLIATGTATGMLNFDSSVGSVRTVTVTPTGNGNGTLGISIDAGTGVDQVQNSSPAATPQPFTEDNMRVGIGISPPSRAATNGTGAPVTYTVQYFDTDFVSSSLTAANIHMLFSGTATGTASVDNSTGATRTVTINNVSGDGTISFYFDPGTAVDVAGNTAAISPFSDTFIVDDTPPTSTVTALPAFSPGSFTLSWSGSDNGGGDNIASYSIYYTEDGGVPQLLVGNTTSTSMTFNGQNGHTYGFYSVATDEGGNVQPTPVSAQTTTTVDTITPTSSVSALPALSLTGFNVSWSGQDNTGGSGLAYYDIYVSDNSGPYTKWLSQVNQTSAMYTNTTPGDSYAFYSIATDNAGNSETKSSADTQTVVPVYTNSSLTDQEDTTAPPSLKISTLLSGHYSDSHGNKNEGIAVTTLDGSGTWQYFNGLAWTPISSISATSSLLLSAKDSLRFLPAFDTSGQADLGFVGWDGSQGTSGGRATISLLGNGAAYSATGGEVTVTIPFAPHAPGWTAASTTLTPVVPGPGVADPGETVQAAFGSVFVDPNSIPGNPNSVPANIAVTALGGTTSGTWMYLPAGGSSPLAFPTKIPAGQGFVLQSSDSILFVPKLSTFVGVVSLSVHAWDGSGGFTDATLVGVNTKSATSPFSTAVLAGNLYFDHAPTQTPVGVIVLNPINENTTSAVQSVKTLVTSTKDAAATDVDKGQTLGMAITGVSGPGVLQYTLGSGVWVSVPATVSLASALLLPGTAQLRFVPTPDQTGTFTLNWLAWDGTEGKAGKQFDTTTNGGATAFSSTGATATLTVNALSAPPAPTWSGTGAALTPVAAGTNQQYNTVASVFASYFRASAGATMGIAVSGVTGTKTGQWLYSTDGGQSWNSLAAVSATNAILLLGTDLIKYAPNAGFMGIVTLTAHAWDGGGSVGDGGAVNLTLKGMTGGSSDISAATLTATCLVNTAPVVLG